LLRGDAERSDANIGLKHGSSRSRRFRSPPRPPTLDRCLRPADGGMAPTPDQAPRDVAASKRSRVFSVIEKKWRACTAKVTAS